MGFELSERARNIQIRLQAFMEEHIYPHEHEFEMFTSNQDNLWEYPPWYEDLKSKAREQGLWNLFLPEEYAPWSPGLSNAEIAPLFETMCRSAWSQEIFNCNAPDRGNMEVLAKYGTEAQQRPRPRSAIRSEEHGSLRSPHTGHGTSTRSDDEPAS